MVSGTVRFGHHIGNPHHFKDFAAQGISTQSVGGRPQDDLARILSSHQVSCQGASAVSVDKENVALGHAASNLDGVFRFERFAETESTASTEVSTDDEGAKGDDATASPHFADTVGTDEHFSPVIVYNQFKIDVKKRREEQREYIIVDY